MTEAVHSVARQRKVLNRATCGEHLPAARIRYKTKGENAKIEII